MGDLVKDERVAILQFLSKKAKDLPRRPGCYLMKNTAGQIIYVGKAKDLKARVSNYFQNGFDSVKTKALVNRIVDFEFMLCTNEAEAYVLENNLIKRHTPRYNVRLKDDKSYPYLVIDQDEPFPRLKYMRRPQRRPSRLMIGPFATGQRVGDVIRSLTKLFLLRDCTVTEFRARKEPCLLYQMRQCSAPCVALISSEEYNLTLKMVLGFFHGEQKVLQVLEEQMTTQSQQQQFERAALLRDQWKFLTEFQAMARQKHAELHVSERDLDVVAYYRGDEEIDLVLSIFRTGLLLGQKNFHFRPYTDDLEGAKEVLMTALIDYYQHCADSLPTSIFVPDDELQLETEVAGWEAVMQSGHSTRLKIRTVSRSMQSFSQLALEQAMENQRMRLSLDEQRWKASTTLKEMLGLEKNPERLECYDIAIWQGQAPTAARISFWRGHPDKQQYRHYHLQQLPEGNNDFAMMKEVLQRRLSDGDMPDVIILDGGKGQLAVGIEVLRELRLKIPMLALAKEKNKGPKSRVAKVEERIYLYGRSNPIQLSRHPELMRLLVQMRDEAHRFSRKLHHKQMKKEFFQNPMDQLKGVSSQHRAKLVEACRQHCLGDVKLLLQWSREEIAQRLDVSQKIAENMWEALHKLE